MRIILIALMLWPAVLAARDDGRYANSPLKDWFGGLASKKGLCCSDADGALVQDADWESKNGHYRVRIDGRWVDVPDDAVITEPNRYGRAMVWGYKSNYFRNMPDAPQVDYVIRCFMAGPMT